MKYDLAHGEGEAYPHLGGGPQRDVLVFSAGGEEYALGIDHIREIIKSRPITEVPRVPAFVAGIIAVRGVVMPVLDLRLRLRLPAAPLSRKARILVVMRPVAGADAGAQDSAREPFGLLVDRVHDVVRLPEHHIEPPIMLSGHEAEFVAGIGRVYRLDGRPDPRGDGHGARPRHIVILLDLGRVLSFEHAGTAGQSLGLASAAGQSLGLATTPAIPAVPIWPSIVSKEKAP